MTIVAFSPCLSQRMEQSMVIKRRRFKQTTSLDERLAQDTAQLCAQAKMLPPGPIRERVIRRIRQNEAAYQLCELLRSPRLQAF
jgi:hypothetical protein